MNNKTFAESFSDFIFTLYKKRPQELPANQLRDLEFAFMAGVVCTNQRIMEVDGLEPSAAINHLSKIDSEIKVYAEKLDEMYLNKPLIN